MNRLILLPLALVSICWVPIQDSDGQLLGRQNCRAQRPMFARPLLGGRTICCPPSCGHPCGTQYGPQCDPQYRSQQNIPLRSEHTPQPGAPGSVYCPETYLYEMGGMHWYEHVFCPNTANKSYDCYETTVATGCESSSTCSCGDCRNEPPTPDWIDENTAATRKDAHAITYGAGDGNTANQRATSFDFGDGLEYFRVIKVEVEDGGDIVFLGLPTQSQPLKDIAIEAQLGVDKTDLQQHSMIVFGEVQNEGMVQITVMRH